MIRASQQNFIIQRPGLIEFYGVDLIMENNLEDFYLLESNRRPNVQEENGNLKYREDGIVDDFSRVASYFFSNHLVDINPDELYSELEYFVPLIDETKKDPYFGVVPKECQTIDVKNYNQDMPLDPMIEPLIQHFRKDRMKFLS
jgi:hypothetical protein